MPSRIIVAFDGSNLAREAFVHALSIARAAKLPVLALHVIEPCPIVPPVGDPLLAFDPTPSVIASPEERAEEEAERRATGERLLKSLLPQAERSGVQVETRIVEGDLISTLCEISGPSDLIALGKKGRFRAAGLGSATRSLVKKSPAPVMVVSVPFMPLRRVLGVFENTDAGRRAVALAREISDATRWPLSVLAVAGHGADVVKATELARAAADGAPVVPLLHAADEPAAIEQAAHESRDALVIVGAYAQSWLHEALFGSAAPRMLKELGVPVVLAH